MCGEYILWYIAINKPVSYPFELFLYYRYACTCRSHHHDINFLFLLLLFVFSCIRQRKEESRSYQSHSMWTFSERKFDFSLALLLRTLVPRPPANLPPFPALHLVLTARLNQVRIHTNTHIFQPNTHRVRIFLYHHHHAVHNDAFIHSLYNSFLPSHHQYQFSPNPTSCTKNAVFYGERNVVGP